MKNLFSWLLRKFVAAFAILIAVQLVTYILGLNLILSGYEKERLRQYEQLAADIIEENLQGSSPSLAVSNPFFVYSADKNLIYSNKGKGKSISPESLRPVVRNDVVIGYFHAGDIGFAENRENRIFLTSIIILSAISLVLSAVIGFLAAWFSSGRITSPVRLLRRDIHGILSYRESPERDFDITELADISDDISKVSNTLRSQEEYKRRWLRDLSHDLRTPLAGLKSQLEAMADGVLAPTPERFRRHLLEIERLENLASSMGELTAIEDRVDLEKTYFSASRFADMLTAPYELEVKNKSIQLEVAVEAEKIYAEEQLLLRGVGNILSNAFKYIEDSGLINIHIAENKIEISNNGPAIPPEQLDLIFTRLFRGDLGRTTPGSGLGLSITREIINLHGGEVRAENMEPRGVLFIIELPAGKTA